MGLGIKLLCLQSSSEASCHPFPFPLSGQEQGPRTDLQDRPKEGWGASLRTSSLMAPWTRWKNQGQRSRLSPSRRPATAQPPTPTPGVGVRLRTLEPLSSALSRPHPLHERQHEGYGQRHARLPRPNQPPPSLGPGLSLAKRQSETRAWGLWVTNRTPQVLPHLPGAPH